MKLTENKEKIKFRMTSTALRANQCECSPISGQMALACVCSCLDQW